MAGVIGRRSGQDGPKSLFFLFHDGKFEERLLRSGHFQLVSCHFPQVEGVVTTAKSTASV